jgi:hypothetical protein
MTEPKDTELLLRLIEQLEIHHNNLAKYMLFHRVPTVLFNRAVEVSADYAQNNMPEVVVFTSNDKEDMWKCAVSKLKVNGYIAEFGVFKGTSVNYLAGLIEPKVIYGFDSFLGLEEDFSLDCPKGKFNLNGIPPAVRNNVSLVQGSFSDTLPEWLENNSGPFSLLNIDCDTYESTSIVLNSLGPERIVSGTFILFDEYFGFHNWEKHEFKAWKEYCTKYDIKYRYVAVCHLQVLVEVL